MIVRKAQELDKRAINELREQVLRVHAAGRPDFFPATFSKELADHLNILFMQENAEVLVADEGGKLLGFACFEYIDRPGTPYRMPARYCHVIELGVADGHRRKGIGRALFEAIQGCAMQRGFGRIELDMWEFNEGALRFYEKMGFRTYRRYMEYS